MRKVLDFVAEHWQDVVLLVHRFACNRGPVCPLSILTSKKDEIVKGSKCYMIIQFKGVPNVEAISAFNSEKSNFLQLFVECSRDVILFRICLQITVECIHILKNPVSF